MVDLLKTLATTLNNEANNIVKHISDGVAYKSDFFNTVYTFESIQQRPRALWGKCGVYVFVVKTPVSLTADEVRKWNNVRGAKFKDYKKKDLRVADCLYVGSGDSIYRRMTDHFNATGESTGLKLASPNRKKVLNCVKVYAFPLRSKYRQYSSIIMREIEKGLHNTLNPVAGSSRV